MRCPECARLMLVAFISDSNPPTRVYQCSTTGVPLLRRNKAGNYRQVGSTTDHTDRYFVQVGLRGTLRRCKPVDLGTMKRKALGGGTEQFHHWTFELVREVA